MSDASKVDSGINLDVLTIPFPAPSVVAGRAEPTPDRAPLAPCLISLGTTLGGPAATVRPMGDSSPSCLPFEDLLVTLRVLESSGGSVPDAFLASLCGKVVFLHEHLFAISGN